MNTGTKRTAYLPDVPTVIESSIKDYDVASWNGLSVLAKTPQAIVATLNTAMKDVILAPKSRATAWRRGRCRRHHPCDRLYRFCHCSRSSGDRRER
jgi:tripartite-type tricarboxylate transporter receptor subunit TctC